MLNISDFVPDFDVSFRRAGGRHGGAYQGPHCHNCGTGHDRFTIWPHENGTGKFRCFKCGWSGTAAYYVQITRGVCREEAHLMLGQEPPPRKGGHVRGSSSAAPPSMQEPPPPGVAWQKRAADFCRSAHAFLWSGNCAHGLAYLHRRGFRDETIRAVGIGYSNDRMYVAPETWGLPVGDGRKMVLPDGVIIPTGTLGRICRVNVRNVYPMEDEPKYRVVSGSTQGLFRGHHIGAEKPVMLCEGELDALAVHQEAGDLVTAVATCSVTHCRGGYFVGLLSKAPRVLVAFDADTKGEEGAEFWLGALANAHRLRPEGHDPGEMLQHGLSIRDWVREALLG